MKTREIAELLNITDLSVSYRFQKLGVYKLGKDYSKDEVDAISYSAWSNAITRQQNLSKDRIRVIELFIKGGDNTTLVIAKELKLNLFFVHTTINNFLKEKYVLGQSKMNFKK